MGDSVAGRTVLITGASSGLGAALARAMAQRGWSTQLVARRAERLEVLSQELTRLAPGTTHTWQALDLTEEDAPARCEAWLRAEGTWPAVIVHNAGFGRFGPFGTVPVAAHDAVITLQVRAVVDLTHRLILPLVEAGRGLVVGIGSTSGRKPVPFLATYAAAKAFLHLWLLALGEELRPYGVKTLLVIPGFMATGFHEKEGLPAEAQPRRAWTPEEVAERLAEAIERGRAGVLVFGTWRERLTGWLQRWLPPSWWATRMGQFYKRWLPDGELGREG